VHEELRRSKADPSRHSRGEQPSRANPVSNNKDVETPLPKETEMASLNFGKWNSISQFTPWVIFSLVSQLSFFEQWWNGMR